jgi:uncharacterized protein YbcI
MTSNKSESATDSNCPTRGQLERNLSQRIQSFYRQQLGHQPSKVTCQLFKEKLAIIIEDSVTPAEQLLAKEGDEDFAERVRTSLGEIIKPQIEALIKEVLEIDVTDLLSDATLETGRTGIIAILAKTPQVRNPESLR